MIDGLDRLIVHIAVGASPARAAGCSVPSHRPNGEEMLIVYAASTWMHSGPYDVSAPANCSCGPAGALPDRELGPRVGS